MVILPQYPTQRRRALHRSYRRRIDHQICAHTRCEEELQEEEVDFYFVNRDRIRRKKAPA